VALVVGTLWGYVGYAILWGLTGIVIRPRFSFSTAGFLAFLPVRLVLRGLRFAEEHVVHHPFRFADNHGWIGVTAAVVGGALVLAFAVVLRWGIRRWRARPDAARGRA